MKTMQFGIMVVVLLAALGCGDSDAPVAAPVTCQTQSDCPGISYCQAGICVKPASTACTSDADCPMGSSCQPTGECLAASACETDSECCFGAPVPCTLQCISGACVGSECTPGVEDACFVGCNKGTKVCENGSWSVCSAPPVADVETCDDGIDNDCNGTTDEGCPSAHREKPSPVRACGEGEMVCSDQPHGFHAMPPRTVPNQRSQIQPCGKCGFEESTCSRRKMATGWPLPKRGRMRGYR